MPEETPDFTPAAFHAMIDDVCHLILGWFIGIPDEMAEECAAELYDVWRELPEATRARYEKLYVRCCPQDARTLYYERRASHGNASE